MRFLGITREAIFSPGRVEDDAAILLAVADTLRQHGQQVDTCSADAAHWPEATPDTVVFTMAQGDRALARLRDWERRGIRVVNSTAGILNCQRHRTVPLLIAAQVAFPSSILLATGNGLELPRWIESGAWVKRGDVHATEADDVVQVDSATAARAALDKFAARGIGRVILQRHVPGRVFKFYAVRDRFFHCVRPDHAPGLNGEILARMEALGRAAAVALDVEVYGGDCVVDARGELTLIDLNDWPSYARCRFEAARAIAAHVGTAQTSCT